MPAGVGLPIVGGGIGMAVLALVVYLMGGDPTVSSTAAAGTARARGGRAGELRRARSPRRRTRCRSSSPSSSRTRRTPGTTIFKQKFGRDYEEPKLVLFTGAVQSACGFAQSAMGPFYCPNDHRSTSTSPSTAS